MFYEKRINSFPKLMEEIGLMDLDSGIRTFGDLKGKKRQFVFVTRSPDDSYTLMVYGASASAPLPGDRLMVKEFHTKKALGEFLRGLLSKPVRAFIY